CHGKAFGAIGTTAGEICFNTGMTGYQEVFTDPSYYGQILIMNTVHIGNYGVKDEDVESDNVKIRGLIGRNLEEQYSRKLAKNSSIRIAVMDYGVKQHILECMVSRGAYVKVFPAKTKLKEVKEFNPSGYFISNGPGDPAAMDYAIDTLKAILKEDKPVFGICL